MRSQDAASRAKTLRLVQWVSLIGSLVIAAIIYAVMDPNLNEIVASVAVVIGVMDFFIFKFLADRIEQGN